MSKIILASASPRRREILSLIGLEYEVEVSSVEEVIPDAPPVEVVQELARQKAADVAGRYPEDIVLGADTIVVVDGAILGKPADWEDAERMIRMISGRSHEVYTGVSICSPEKNITFAEKTVVYIRDMDEQEIQSYLSSSEPYDKAGSYAVQGLFARYIEKLDGDYYNVMGLPACKIYLEMKKQSLL